MPPKFRVKEVSARLQSNDDDRESKWFLTINTNKKPQTPAQARSYANALRRGLRAIFSDDNVHKLFKFKRGGPEDIKSLDFAFNLEMGKHAKGGRIHSHAFFRVRHRAILQLNFPWLHANLARAMQDDRIKSVHFHAKLLKSDYMVRRYMRKAGYDPDTLMRRKVENVESLNDALSTLDLNDQ